jgi:hypothetical protein
MYARPRGLGDDQAQLTALQQTLNNLSRSIAAAKASGQLDAATALQQQWTDVKAQVDALVKSLYGQDMPSPFALGVANLADTVRGLGGKAALVAGLVLAALVVGPALARSGARQL